MTSPRIAKIRDCIRNIESAGWTYEYYNRPWYCFRRPSDRKQIIFTLTEIRDAYNNGW